jgi:hypothetical protein
MIFDDYNIYVKNAKSNLFFQHHKVFEPFSGEPPLVLQSLQYSSMPTLLKIVLWPVIKKPTLSERYTPHCCNRISIGNFYNSQYMHLIKYIS